MRKYYDPTADWATCKFLGADIFLPESPGVYVVVGECHLGSGEPVVYYVGEAKNMRLRWKRGHDKALALVREGAHTIRFFVTKQHKELEPKLIAYYEPVLNRTTDKVLMSTSGYFRFNAEEWQ
jgi:excinuclease UvrABC nuclease subunit